MLCNNVKPQVILAFAGMLKQSNGMDSMYLAQLQKSFPGFFPNAGII